jgi:hypothetical protein
MTKRTCGAKSVYVRTYLRFRFGKWESVCDHYRDPPTH